LLGGWGAGGWEVMSIELILPLSIGLRVVT
jgi:hypothetical protein